MNINDFKKEVFSTFHIFKVSPDITDQEWLEFSKKLAQLKPRNKVEASKLLHSFFPRCVFLFK